MGTGEISDSDLSTWIASRESIGLKGHAEQLQCGCLTNQHSAPSVPGSKLRALRWNCTAWL